MKWYEFLQNNSGYRLIGFLDDSEKPYLNVVYLGPISNLENVSEEKDIDNVIVALRNHAVEKVEE